jgi:hypothetical protein
MSLRKSFPFGTRRFEFRWDVFNVLNHTTSGTGADQPDVADFG